VRNFTTKTILLFVQVAILERSAKSKQEMIDQFVEIIKNQKEGQAGSTPLDDPAVPGITAVQAVDVDHKKAAAHIISTPEVSIQQGIGTNYNTCMPVIYKQKKSLYMYMYI
jgi:hypothetical protein